MKNRPIYTAKIEPFIDKPIVKVITGIRRSGKSGLLQLLQQHLKECGVTENQIVYLNYESLRWSSYRTYDTLYAYVDGIRPKDARCYLFIDEIQEVAEWERAVNSMMVDWDVDIYITGSNSRLLSSELATYLAGRYVEFLVHPLSYKEFLHFHGYKNLEGGDRIDRFDQYMRQGGFPMFHLYDYDDEEIYRAVRDIYASVLLRDTVQRYSIRNIEMLERLVHFLFDNIGNTFSASSIIRYLKSQGRSLDSETLYNYLQAQETFCIACRRPEAALCCPNPQGWLVTTLRYVVRNMQRLLALREKRVITLAEPEGGVPVFDDYTDAEYADLLTDEEYRLFRRIAVDRYTMREAAYAFGISEEACKKRVQRIRARLQKKILEIMDSGVPEG